MLDSLSKQQLVSRFIFRRRDSLWQCWRAFWLALGIAFAMQNLRGELILAEAFDGKPHTPAQLLSVAQKSLSAFPFERDLRNSANRLIWRATERMKQETKR